MALWFHPQSWTVH